MHECMALDAIAALTIFACLRLIITVMPIVDCVWIAIAWIYIGTDKFMIRPRWPLLVCVTLVNFLPDFMVFCHIVCWPCVCMAGQASVA